MVTASPHGAARGQLVLETDRLRIRVAAINDAGHFYALWTNPRVMGNVGFPNGLPITREKITAQLAQQGERVFDSRLIVILREGDIPIGECKLGWPNEAGVSTTDVKILPQFWGNKYGVEIKRALVDYLFKHTSCRIIEATPNIKNIASIKMQEAVGGVRIGEDTFPVSPDKQAYMVPVHHYIYRVFREDWLTR
jgi:RimJ/RimL family protein N-acetyltransferase